MQANRNLKCSQSFNLGDDLLNQTYSRQLTINVPSYAKSNGSLSAFVILGPKSLLKSNQPLTLDSNWPEKLFIKELMLSKYKQNRSDIYVNLLEAATKNSEANEALKKVNNEKPITHLLTNINIYSMDTNINFDRYQVPGEFHHDIK